MRICFISEVTSVDKPTIVTNDATLGVAILVSSLEFYPRQPGQKFPHEQTTKFVLVTEIARLPGSYEEALTLVSLSWLFRPRAVQWSRI